MEPSQNLIISHTDSFGHGIPAYVNIASFDEDEEDWV